jgi:hypothetical protein
MTNPHLHVLTQRLDLRKTNPVGDLDDLYAIFWSITRHVISAR